MRSWIISAGAACRLAHMDLIALFVSCAHARLLQVRNLQDRANKQNEQPSRSAPHSSRAQSARMRAAMPLRAPQTLQQQADALAASLATLDEAVALCLTLPRPVAAPQRQQQEAGSGGAMPPAPPSAAFASNNCGDATASAQRPSVEHDPVMQLQTVLRGQEEVCAALEAQLAVARAELAAVSGKPLKDTAEVEAAHTPEAQASTQAATSELSAPAAVGDAPDDCNWNEGNAATHRDTELDENLSGRPGSRISTAGVDAEASGPRTNVEVHACDVTATPAAQHSGDVQDASKATARQARATMRSALVLHTASKAAKSASSLARHSMAARAEAAPKLRDAMGS